MKNRSLTTFIIGGIIITQIIVYVLFFYFEIPMSAHISTRLLSRLRSATRDRTKSKIDENDDVFHLVDTKIGTRGDGNVWVGASVPHGIIKTGIDSKFTQQGYSWEKPITGISFLHVSGTGGGDSYQVINVHPVIGTLANLKMKYRTMKFGNPFVLSSKRSNETSRPNFFGVTLDQVNVHVEMTASSRSAIHRYYQSRPINGEQIFIVVDISRTPGPNDMFRGGWIKYDAEMNAFMGKGRYREHWAGGLGLGNDGRSTYEVYFCVVGDGKHSGFGVWDYRGFEEFRASAEASSGNLGGFFVYDSPENAHEFIGELRIGISFKSYKKACENVEHETIGLSFTDVMKRGRQEWINKISRIKIDRPINEKLKKMFYSAVYRSFMMPVNRTGDWTNDETDSMDYWDDFYCLWDTFRTLHPFLTLIAPNIQASVVNGLVNIYRKEGWFSDSRVAGINGIVQGGSNAVVLITDAYVKQLPGIDWELAFEAASHDAEVEPSDFLYEGRGDLNLWTRMGYIPRKSGRTLLHQRSASRTMEYAFNDFCVAVLAKALGKDYEKYIERSHNWKNLWNPGVRSLGNHTGFIVPRTVGGKFVNDHWSDPTLCSPLNFENDICFFSNGEFYEDSSWSYSFFVPHDVYGLMSIMGGKKKFVDRLDTFFERGLYNPGNEPAFLTPYLYVFAGRHDRCAKTVRWLVDKYYGPGPDGIPGNDDGGAMSTNLIFHLLGFYPLAGTDLYLLGTPHFYRSEIKVEQGRFIIIAHNLDVDNLYVEKVYLDGISLNRAWLRHSEIVSGAKLELWMSKKPSPWDTVQPPIIV